MTPSTSSTAAPLGAKSQHRIVNHLDKKGYILLKSFVTSESDLRAIWMRLASHFVLGFCLWLLLKVDTKYACVLVGLKSLNDDCS